MRQRLGLIDSANGVRHQLFGGWSAALEEELDELDQPGNQIERGLQPAGMRQTVAHLRISVDALDKVFIERIPSTEKFA